MWTGSAGQEVNTGEKWYDAEEELELPEDDVATAVRQDPTPVTAHVSDGERANSALGLNVLRIKILSSCSCFHSRISQSGGHELRTVCFQAAQQCDGGEHLLINVV